MKDLGPKGFRPIFRLAHECKAMRKTFTEILDNVHEVAEEAMDKGTHQTEDWF